jgi:hypothetical protein
LEAFFCSGFVPGVDEEELLVSTLAPPLDPEEPVPDPPSLAAAPPAAPLP